MDRHKRISECGSKANTCAVAGNETLVMQPVASHCTGQTTHCLFHALPKSFPIVSTVNLTVLHLEKF